MTGHVLIVDALAINRIVLKAALSAAFYVVKQASTASEAIEIFTDETPDVILIGGDLPDMSAADLIQRFDMLCTAPVPPVMLLLTANTPEARVAALQAGASDVLAHPLDEDELFARLRALLRQRRLDSDLVTHAKTANALGLSEDPVAFTGPERAAILSADETTAKAICARLTPFCNYQLVPVSHDRAAQILSGRAKPDVTLLHIDCDTEAGLRRLASLQAGSNGRDMRVIALTETETSGHAAKLLDMGASDVVHLHDGTSLEDHELAFRLSQQMARKKQSDTLRGHLENGLQAAVIDPLTGLHNRRYAQVYLRRMIDDARAEQQRCAVMIADLDFFKSVNDTFGHAAGDRVLIRTAEVMRYALPNDTMIARIGGEEFLIAVPDTTLPDVRALARHVGRMVRENDVPLADRQGSVHVTVSIGATLVHPANMGELTADMLIEQADKALYDSKSGGRDTVTVTLRPAA